MAGMTGSNRCTAVTLATWVEDRSES